MVKAIEAAGLPVVHMCTVTPIVQMCNLVPVAKTVGSNRIVPTISIPYPLGDPTEGEEESYKIREKLVRRAFKALQTPITEQTVFEKDEW
mgnify:CR=1 FL=1